MHVSFDLEIPLSGHLSHKYSCTQVKMTCVFKGLHYRIAYNIKRLKATQMFNNKETV